MSVVEVRDLTVTYSEVLGARDVTFTARPGLTVVVGVNGSGKSTVLGALAGAVRPDRGQILIDGQDAQRFRAAGKLAYVPQLDAIDRDFPLTVAQVVDMGCEARGLTRRGRREAALEALEQVDLAHLAARQIGQLSGGQRRRVLMARALAQRAQVYLLDEPDAGADPTARDLLASTVTELTAAGATVIMTTHDLSRVPRAADHAIVMHRTVVAAGPPSEVLTAQTLARIFGPEAA